MCRVPDHRDIAGLQPALDAYSVGQGSRKQLERFLDDGLDVHWNALTKTAAAESENAIDERLGSPGRVHDVVQVAAHGRAFGRMLVAKLPVTQERSEDVVEIVCEAAGQCPDCLHLL